jgi:hypothetical protein
MCVPNGAALRQKRRKLSGDFHGFITGFYRAPDAIPVSLSSTNNLEVILSMVLGLIAMV